MGFRDSVLGGGSQQVKTKIPGYIEDPSSFIGYRVNKLTRDVNRRGFNPIRDRPLLVPFQHRARADMDQSLVAERGAINARLR